VIRAVVYCFRQRLACTLHPGLPTSRHGMFLRPCRYTWSIYANRLVTLSHIYTFWKRVTSIESRETKRYLGKQALGCKWNSLAGCGVARVPASPAGTVHAS
jgi:hypothetical protein